MNYYSYAFLINHINILISTRNRSALIRYNKNLLKLLSLFREYGVVNSSLIISKKKKLIKISPFVYKRSSFFKGVKLISTPSKAFTVKLSALRIIDKSLGSTILILETSKGIMRHTEALKHNIGGRMLCIIT